MTVFDGETFEDAKELQEMNLAVVNIDHLKGSFFRIVHTLNDIDLTFCQIGTISLSVIDGVSRAREIGLTNNKINEISQELYDLMAKLQNHGVDMVGNEIYNLNIIQWIPADKRVYGKKSNIGVYFLFVLLLLAIFGIAATFYTRTRRDDQLIIVLSELNANLSN